MLMTVLELVKELETYPPYMKVCDAGFDDITKVSIETKIYSNYLIINPTKMF